MYVWQETSMQYTTDVHVHVPVQCSYTVEVIQCNYNYQALTINDV